MKQIIATIAGVEVSAVTIISIKSYGSTGRRLLQSSIIVDFSIRLPQGATSSQVPIVERSLNTRNIVDGIQSSSDETIKSILPSGIVVYTVVQVDSDQAVDSVDNVEEGTSIVLVVIVAIVSVIIVSGISILICCKCRSSVKKPQNPKNASDAQFSVTRTSHHNINVHRDEDMFTSMLFYSDTTTPIIPRHTPKILDYSMI